jgi:hypothetical protein
LQCVAQYPGTAGALGNITGAHTKKHTHTNKDVSAYVSTLVNKKINQVQGFRLTQHWFGWKYFRLKMVRRLKHVAVTK